MKKIFLILIILLIAVSCKEDNDNPVTPKTNKTIKRYSVQSGIIKYKSTTSGKLGNTSFSGEGTSSTYFNNWGALEMREKNATMTSTVTLDGRTITSTETTKDKNKLDNIISYTVDFENKKIFKSKDFILEAILESHPNADAEEVGLLILKRSGGKKIGEEIFKGYNCEIWELLNVKQWIYKGVPLKIVSDINANGSVITTEEAISIEFNIDVSDSNFKLPNYPIEEI